jgi:hypothetical protein
MHDLSRLVARHWTYCNAARSTASPVVPMLRITTQVWSMHAAIGKGRVIPAGPLRAPLVAQLRLAHALVAVGTDSAGRVLLY